MRTAPKRPTDSVGRYECCRRMRSTLRDGAPAQKQGYRRGQKLRLRLKPVWTEFQEDVVPVLWSLNRRKTLAVVVFEKVSMDSEVSKLMEF